MQNIYCPTTQAGQTAKEKMRITQVRDDGKVNTMRTLKIEQLVEQMKKETKAQLVSNMREVLPYILPGDKNDYIERVPKILPAAAFVRKNGVMAMLVSHILFSDFVIKITCLNLDDLSLTIEKDT